MAISTRPKQVVMAVVVVWLCSFLLYGHHLNWFDSYQNQFKAPQPAAEQTGYDFKSEYSSSAGEEEDEPHTQEDKFEFKSAKKILFFTSYFHLTDWQFGFGHQPFLDHGCPVNNCYTTNNKSLLASLADFDAILFHIRDMNKGHLALPHPKKRKASQRYVMFLMESPMNDDFPYDKFSSYFNWTMTYRRDSDFPRPYGWIAKKGHPWHYPPSCRSPQDWTYPLKISPDGPPGPHPPKNFSAWMVSNCHTNSEREAYIADLQKYIPIDIYGGCGSKSCPRNEQNGDKACLELLSRSYKFYFSFENSICADYVTEKFWNAMGMDLIPVVLGGADYSVHAPPKSYINAQDFKTPQALADYLKFLDANHTAYTEYFEWKKHFDLLNKPSLYSSRAMCQLCEHLHSSDREEKQYSDMTSWWRTKASCKPKGSFPWSRPEEKVKWSSFLVQNTKNLIKSLRHSNVIF